MSDPRIAAYVGQLTTRKEISDAKQLDRAADIRRRSDERPASMQRIVLTADQLATAASEGNPYKIPFPFNSFHVESATDQTVEVRLSPDDQSVRSIANYKTLKLNDSGVFTEVLSGGYLTWAAQAGKTMTIVFFVDVDWRSGSQLSLTAGGISISDGSAVATSVVTLAAAAATVLFAADSTRKLGTWINDTGITQYIGPATVTATGATKGMPVAPGAVIEWRNTAALYAFNTGAAFDTVAMSES
ncbi:MAG: hypothetical protein AB7F66_17685 [Bacteriovoracia bacterium]